ncbi:MAG: type II secretion system GspH family protein [Lentisphaeria bacterium]|nr:type II secretion system GspH family protein [Lentisphaeria bacterium]
MKVRFFTLLELIVVIGIIAVLAALVLPAFAKARDKGRKVVCINNLKQVGIGFILYGDTYDDSIASAAVNWKINYSYQLSQDFYVSDEVFHCPTDNILRINGYDPRSYTTNVGTRETIGKAQEECDGPTRMGAFNHVNFSDVGSDTILLLEYWEDINYRHGYPRADMFWGWWNFKAKLDTVQIHYASPNFLKVDGSVEAIRSASLERGYFTAVAGD